MPTGAKNGKTQLVAIRMPNDLDELIRKVSADRGVSYTAIVVAALQEFMAKEDVAE